MAEHKVRDLILKLTPLGSSPGKVLSVVNDVLRKPTNAFKRNYYGADPDSNQTMYYAGSIGIIYNQTTGWFLVGTETAVDWYFDDHERLLT